MKEAEDATFCLPQHLVLQKKKILTHADHLMMVFFFIIMEIAKVGCDFIVVQTGII